MAPSSGNLLVPKAIRIVKFAISKTTSLIRSKLPQPTTTSSSANPILQPIRLTTHSQLLPPLARIRQARSQRWLHTTLRNLSSTSKARANGRSTFPTTKVAQAIRQRGAAPFGSTLRPNLTGGTLPRTAGGYGLGGTGRAVRHFSQTPSCQAHVIQNVNAGIRAFFVSGGKARFDGVDPITGEKRFKAVTPTEDEVLRKIDAVKTATVKGASLEFRLSPTVTALLPSVVVDTKQTLGTEGLLEGLSTDFAHALKTLSLTLADLSRLSALGSLPISVAYTSKGPILSVRFPGCDAETVSLLCEELGVFRGIVREDVEWDDSKEVEMALLFPFTPTGHDTTESDASNFFEQKARGVNTIIAPSQLEWQGMMTPSTDIHTPSSTASYEHVTYPLLPPASNPRSPSGYESMHDSDYGDEDPYFDSHTPYPDAQTASPRTGKGTGSEDFEGLEGIYRFLRECENARR